MKYEIDTVDLNRLNQVYRYHSPKGDQDIRYIDLRRTARTLAEKVLGSCPPSRERSNALTKIEEASFWANASIARNE